MRPVYLCLIIFFAALLSCSKDGFINSSNARLSVSESLITFDTVFTSTGSITKFFKIFNDNDARLRINEIHLAGGADSRFTININGLPTHTAQDLIVDANDSIYVFVTANIGATGGNAPFIVEDSISILFNGNKRWVQLQAWGQDAHFIRNARLNEDQTWTNDKPYVIIGGMRLEEGNTLTIEAGCRIYSHADAPMIIDGTLKAIGEEYDSMKVTFQSDRLDRPYSEHPGSWPGIVFSESSMNNELRFVQLKNAYQGIVIRGNQQTETQLKLSETIISGCYDAGILSFGAVVEGDNILINNCGKGIVLAHGGQYRFRHCTIAGLNSPYLPHKEASLQISDNVRDAGVVYINELNALFENCIIWGSDGIVEDEVLVHRAGNEPFRIRIDNSIIRWQRTPSLIEGDDNIINEDPGFIGEGEDTRQFDFHLAEWSVAIDKGKRTSVAIDLDGITRDTLPDIGCYEKRP